MTEITTEKAIDFLKRYDNDEVYTPLCVNSHKLAIKALEENEQIKAQINRWFQKATDKMKAENDHDEKLLDYIEQLQKENERLKADKAGLIEDIERWNEASYEHHENIKKAKEKIENKETYDGIYIDRADVLKVLDELTEGETENER